MFARAWGWAAVVFALVACLLQVRRASSGKGGASAVRLAVIPKGTTHEFWKIGPRRRGEGRAGARRRHRLEGPAQGGRSKAQIDVVQTFIAQGVSGIVLAPLNDKGARRAGEAGGRAKIPVVIFDSDLQGRITSSFVATDNFAAGSIAGARPGQARSAARATCRPPLPGGLGQHGQPRERLSRGREEEPRHRSRQRQPVRRRDHRERVRDERESARSRRRRATGASTASSARTSRPRSACCSRCKGGPRGQGRSSSASTARRSSSRPCVRRADRRPVLQNPFNMGYLAVKTMAAHLRGREGRGAHRHRRQLVTKENIDQPDIKELSRPTSRSGSRSSACPRATRHSRRREAFGPTVALGGVELRGRSRAGARALRRERRRQEHADEHPRRRRASPTRARSCSTARPIAPQGPLDARRAGRRDGAPGALALPAPHRSRRTSCSACEPAALRLASTRARCEQRARRRSRRCRCQRRGPAASRRAAWAICPLRRSSSSRSRARCRRRSCRVLILDEPTSSLAADDVERLFAVDARAARARARHRLHLAFPRRGAGVADAFTVLRDGKTVGDRHDGRRRRSRDIVALMAGRAGRAALPAIARARRATPSSSSMALRGVDKPAARQSHAARRGEVLGIAGLVGAGRTELLRAHLRARSGEAAARSRSRRSRALRRPAQRLAQGVGLLSEDRKGEGLAHSLSIADNLTLSKLSRARPAGLVSPQRQRQRRTLRGSKLSASARAIPSSRCAICPAATSRRSRSRGCSTTTSTCCSSTSRRAASTSASKAQIYAAHRRARGRGQGGAHGLELPARAARRLRPHRGHAPRQARARAAPSRELTEHAVLMEATGA